MLTEKALKFWDHPDFKRQQELIANTVDWEVSEKIASLHRTWLETSEVTRFLRSQAEPFVAEIGCGVGRLLKEFRKDYRCYGMDISSNMLLKAANYLGVPPEGSKLVSYGLIEDGRFTLKDEVVSFIYSFLVFQHIQTKEEIDQYLKEISRVLVPGGYFRVQTYKGTPHREDRFGGFHGRFYPSLKSFEMDLYGHGLTVVDMQEGLGYPKWLWATLRKQEN